MKALTIIVGIAIGLVLVIVSALAVVGTIFLFGEQDDWVEVNDKQDRK